MRSIAVALLILFALPLGASGQSQQPPQREQPQQQTEQPKQSPAADERGTEKSPLIIKVIPAPKSQQDTDQEEKERSEKTELDRKLVQFNGDLAKYTFGIEIVAGLQFVALILQAIFLGKTLQATNRALYMTERAFVFINEFHTDWYGANYVIKPQWRNSGSTPMREGTIRIAWNYFDEPKFPPEFNYEYEEPAAPLFLGPQAMEWSAPIEIPDAITTRANQGKTHIFIWGRADYRDIFGRPHFTEWCYRIIFYLRPGLLVGQFVAFGPHNRTDAG